MSSTSGNALKSLIENKRKHYQTSVANAEVVAAASTTTGQIFVRRGDLTDRSQSFVDTTQTNATEATDQPSRKRSRNTSPTATTDLKDGIGAEERARQQRILMLRKKAAEANAVAKAQAAEEAATQAALAIKTAQEQAVAKRKAKAAAAASSSSSSSSTASTNTKTKTEEPIPRDESALQLEDAKQAGKNLRRIFKMFLDQWSQELRERDDRVKRTAIGRDDSKRFKECKDNIRPLFKLSRQGELASDLRIAIRRIAHYILVGDYRKAHDQYIGIAIGNAAWPIGVTMVGIHARGGRERIQSNKIAHAMDDDMTLKYLTSIKRILTFCKNRHLKSINMRE